jgi:hypothetical protein
MSKQVSWAGKKQFGIYKNENRFARNKLRKLTRHMKQFPNDKVTAAVLETGIKHGFVYKRKEPIAPCWSKSDKAMLGLMHSIDGITGKEYLENKRNRLRIQRKEVE